jgi:CheY-like chemotaxis protein
MTECRSPGLPRPDADQPRRILVVDDEEMVRDLLARFLSERGYLPSPAADGAQALELFRSQPFDLVLSDVRMPGLSGLQLLQAVKEVNPRVPVVLISGFGEVETVVEALKAGAENFLAKPLKLEMLEKVVEQSLSLACIRPGLGALGPRVEQETVVTAPSRPDYICEVVYQVALSAVAVGFAEMDLDNNLKLALVEAVTNAMEHGNRWTEARKVEVTCRARRDRLEVVVRDQGPGFDYQNLGDPTEEDNLLCERGRGVFLMQAIMDEVSFQPPGNQVTLRKRRREEEAGAPS